MKRPWRRIAEDALSERDALASAESVSSALTPPDASPRPIFIDDDGPSPIPDRVTTTNAVQMFGLRPGESIQDAIARQGKEMA